MGAGDGVDGGEEGLEFVAPAGVVDEQVDGFGDVGFGFFFCGTLQGQFGDELAGASVENFGDAVEDLSFQVG